MEYWNIRIRETEINWKFFTHQYKRAKRRTKKQQYYCRNTHTSVNTLWHVLLHKNNVYVKGGLVFFSSTRTHLLALIKFNSFSLLYWCRLCFGKWNDFYIYNCTKSARNARRERTFESTQTRIHTYSRYVHNANIHSL